MTEEMANDHGLAAAQDKIDALDSELFEAVQVAYSRGAVDWTRRNYPRWAKQMEAARTQPPSSGGEIAAFKTANAWIREGDVIRVHFNSESEALAAMESLVAENVATA